MGKNRQDYRAQASSRVSSKSDGGLSLTESIFVVLSAAAIMLSVLGIYILRTPRDSVELIDIQLPKEYDLSIINSATEQEFMQVKGIGEVKAKSLIELRNSLGGFKDIREVTYVDGISDNILRNIIEYFYGEQN